MKSFAALNAAVIRRKTMAAGHTGNAKYTVTTILPARIGKRLMRRVGLHRLHNIPEGRL